MNADLSAKKSFVLEKLKSNLEIFKVIKWKIKNFSHGFTTRNTGRSTGPFRSFNLGHSVNDNLDNVEKNWNIFSDAVKIPRSYWLSMKQVHGNNMVLIKDKACAKKIKLHPPRADSLISSITDYAPTVKTADCAPILIMCRNPKIAGAIHAGWRGTTKNICKKCVNKIIKTYKISPDSLEAAIGPSIGQCCFEVGKDVASNFLKEFVKEKNGKFYVNLWDANKKQLLDCGIKNSNIHISRICTYCNKDLFYSHRRDKGVTGRMAAWASWQK